MGDGQEWAVPKKRRSKKEPVKRDDRSRDFLDWISRHKYCSTCGRPGVYHDKTGEYLLHPSHIKTRGSGGGDIGNVVPQCAFCHSLIHQIGVKQFQEKTGVDLNGIAERLGGAWEKIYK